MKRGPVPLVLGFPPGLSFPFTVPLDKPVNHGGVKIFITQLYRELVSWLDIANEQSHDGRSTVRKLDGRGRLD